MKMTREEAKKILEGANDYCDLKKDAKHDAVDLFLKAIEDPSELAQLV